MLLSAFPEALVAEGAIAEVLHQNLVAADLPDEQRHSSPDAGTVRIDAGACRRRPGLRVERGHLSVWSLQKCVSVGVLDILGCQGINFFQTLNDP